MFKKVQSYHPIGAKVACCTIQSSQRSGSQPLLTETDGLILAFVEKDRAPCVSRLQSSCWLYAVGCRGGAWGKDQWSGKVTLFQMSCIYIFLPRTGPCFLSPVDSSWKPPARAGIGEPTRVETCHLPRICFFSRDCVCTLQNNNASERPRITNNI